MKTNKKENTIDRVVRLYERGHSCTEIAEITDTNLTYVLETLRNKGFEPQSFGSE